MVLQRSAPHSKWGTLHYTYSLWQMKIHWPACYVTKPMYCQTCNYVPVHSTRPFPGFINHSFRIIKVRIDLRHLSLLCAELGQRYAQEQSPRFTYFHTRNHHSLHSIHDRTSRFNRSRASHPTRTRASVYVSSWWNVL